MLVTRLGAAVSNFRKINRYTSLIQRTASTKSVIDTPDDKPIPLSTTDAATWKAEHTRMPPYKRAWFTPYVITASVGIFLLYFCVLREENDIDDMIYRPLPETLQGIDKVFTTIDFQTKPDYVIYHEEKKRKKLEATLQQK